MSGYKRIHVAVLLLVLGVGGCVAAMSDEVPAYEAAEVRTLNTTCSSVGTNEVVECHADYLISELTNVEESKESGGCERGKSYFIEGYVIRVCAGCAATFTYRSVVNFFDVQAVNCTCEHWAGAAGHGDIIKVGHVGAEDEDEDAEDETECDVGFPIREVRVVEQLSEATCQEFEGYELTWHSIVTFGGCRAKFAVYV